MADPLPVVLVTGFLGSGKTTLISALLAHPDMGETAVLVNELGEVPIDHHLVRQVDERTIVLDSGCVCCTPRARRARPVQPGGRGDDRPRGPGAGAVDARERAGAAPPLRGRGGRRDG